jgi:hypothetical protein
MYSDVMFLFNCNFLSIALFFSRKDHGDLICLIICSNHVNYNVPIIWTACSIFFSFVIWPLISLAWSLRLNHPPIKHLKKISSRKRNASQANNQTPWRQNPICKFWLLLMKQHLSIHHVHLPFCGKRKKNKNKTLKLRLESINNRQPGLRPAGPLSMCSWLKQALDCFYYHLLNPCLVPFCFALSEKFSLKLGQSGILVCHRKASEACDFNVRAHAIAPKTLNWFLSYREKRAESNACVTLYFDH